MKRNEYGKFKTPKTTTFSRKNVVIEVIITAA